MQIEVMSLRGSQWLQLFLEQAQIGQMVEHWCKEHPVACSTYYHWKKALRAHWHLACPHGSETPDSGAPNSRRSVHKSATVWR